MHIHKSHPAIVRAAAFNNLVKKSQVQSHAFIFYSSLTLLEAKASLWFTPVRQLVSQLVSQSHLAG